MDRRLLEVKILPYDANLSSKSHHEVVGCANAKSLNVVGAPTASSLQWPSMAVPALHCAALPVPAHHAAALTT